MDLRLRLAFGPVDFSDIPTELASIPTALLGTAAQLVVLAAFTATAYALVRAWVESYVALTGGVLFLAFGAFPGTVRYAENYLNYLNYLVFLGIRLFVLYLLLGVGSTVLTRMADAIHRAPGSAGTQQMAAVVAAAVIVAGSSSRIPANIAGRITASHSFGLVDALRGHS